ncbi:MAG: ribosome silencing factor [Defluviitaleaceae bacterium]|nr:ribosome silencing factor [Defluviitaleaceae bacterium]
MSEKSQTTELTAVMALHKALDKKFAKDIVIIELDGLSPIADYFVIATGGSAPQLAALTETSEQLLKTHGMSLHHTEGLQSGKWVLLDFGAIIVHLFDKESRDYYNLERIWGDAKIINP